MTNKKPNLYPILSGNSRLNIPISCVTGARGNKIKSISTLDKILDQLQDENNTELILLSKELKKAKKTNPKIYKELKEEKCSGLIIGKFSKRLDEECEVYVSLLGFDIDGIQSEFDTSCHLANCKNNPYIFLAFPSPSGLGLRIFVWCESKPETHKSYYEAICENLSDSFKIKMDKSIREQLKKQELSKEEISSKLKETERIDTGTKNISRIWFYSHQKKEDIYLNIESKVFKMNHPIEVQKNLRPQYSIKDSPYILISQEEKIRLCETITNQKNNIASGRNNYIFQLACVMWEHGLPEKKILSHCLKYQENDFPEPEIKKTITSATKKATFQKFTDKQLLVWKSKFEGTKGIKQNQTNENQNKKVEELSNDKYSSLNKFQKIKYRISSKYDLRLNIISNELEFKEKNNLEPFSILNENDLIIDLLESGLNGVEAPLMSLLRSKFVVKYDPFKQYFKDLPNWKEGDPDYINQLANFVIAKDQDWFNYQFKKMLVRSVACALNIIPFNKHCFTLIGKQNDGKTSFIRYLCPSKLSEYIKDNPYFANKDGMLTLAQNFYINLDELANISKYDINQIKKIFTMDSVKERLPYDRKPQRFPRRANFLASTNSHEFLTDETGNVRWLVFEIKGIQHDNGGKDGYNKNINIDLVYSQAYTLLKNNFNFKLTKEDIQQSEKNNHQYQINSIEMDLIQSRFSPATKQDHNAFLTTTEILQKIEMEVKTKITSRSLGRALKILGFEKTQKFYKEYNQQRKGYYINYLKEAEKNTF